GRRGRVVAEIASSSSGTRSTSSFARVLFPSPEVPVRTKTGREPVSAVEEANQLRPLAVREAADGLRLADPALVEEARGLDAAELRHRHQHVEDLRRRDVLRRVAQDFLDRRGAGLEVLLQLRASHTDVVSPLERFHSLVEGAERRLGLSLKRGHGGGY